ncbi:MAG: aldo/keto reductase [Candidatus Neomarinimicrobiota bacterium]|nr:aldo/keto reductase [Candidatus Neomarinimicrobiota bacterium]
MNYRRLGRSGLKLSELSYGSWVTFSFQLDVDASTECMKTAYDAGVNFFDNAEVYANGESELIMGKVLNKMGWLRDSYCVSSKVFWGGDKPTQRGLSRKHIHDACHAALERLQVDYLDLFFCHRPDRQTPIEETVRAMDVLVKQGKVLYWGTSEWSADEIRAAYGIAKQHNLEPPTMEQPQYNLFERDKLEGEYLRLFQDEGLGTTIWSPLASGILTGKYGDGIPSGSRMELPEFDFLRNRLESEVGREMVEKTKKLASLSSEIGISLVHLGLAWCLKNPNVSTVILGASNVDQLKDNLEAAETVDRLTPEMMEKIEAIVQSKPEAWTDW